MVEVETKIFGKIAVEDEKVIYFERGILGFPDLKRFTLVYDVERGNEVAIKWMQSLDEPAFALPVMNPDLVIPGFTPAFPEELLSPLGDNLEEQDNLIFVTVTVPSDITKTTVNLKAPIIINTESMRAVQLICEDETLSIKYAIYDKIMAKQH